LFQTEKSRFIHYNELKSQKRKEILKQGKKKDRMDTDRNIPNSYKSEMVRPSLETNTTTTHANRLFLNL